MSRNLDPMDAIDSIFVRLDRQLARIAALETDVERLESASGVPQEPGNATEARSTPDDLPPLDDMEAMLYLPPRLKPEVAAALRMYWKVQGCRTAPNGDVIRPGAGNVLTAHILLAWLREGEAWAPGPT